MKNIVSRSGFDAASDRAAFSFIRLCDDCKREILPQLAVNSLRLDMHRTPSKGMARDDKPDPKAERIRARKERKSTGRRNLTHGTLEAVKLIVRGRMEQQATVTSDECPKCRDLQAEAKSRSAA